MIKFFRRIRQQMLQENRFTKYLLYAIGEIVLVVIGILIALQINNWNEEKKDRLVEINYLKRLLVDLENDQEILNLSKGLSKNRLDQINLLDDVILNPYTVNAEPKQILESIEKVAWRSYLPLSRIVYNELLNSGKMSLIQSEKLRTKLSHYYGAADHWEMILNMEEAQKEFGHATAGLLPKNVLAAIENSESADIKNSKTHLVLDMESVDMDSIVYQLSSNKNATKWLPRIYHYHVLADKVINDLSTQNEVLKQLVLDEL